MPDSGSTAMSRIPRVWPLSVYNLSPVETRQTFIVASTLPENSIKHLSLSFLARLETPSARFGLNDAGRGMEQVLTQLTKSECPTYLCRWMHVVMSHDQIVLSQQPAKSNLADASIVSDVTGCRGPLYVCVVLFVYPTHRQLVIFTSLFVHPHTLRSIRLTPPPLSATKTVPSSDSSRMTALNFAFSFMGLPALLLAFSARRADLDCADADWKK